MDYTMKVWSAQGWGHNTTWHLDIENTATNQWVLVDITEKQAKAISEITGQQPRNIKKGVYDK